MMILGIVRVTGQNGCPSCPNIDIYFQSTNAATCGECDGSIDLCVVGQSPFTYAWTGPNGFSSTEEDLENLCPGWYTVTVTNAWSNTKTISTYVFEDCFCTLGGVISSTPLSCTSNGTATIFATGGTEPYFYQWSTGEDTETIEVNQPGMYQVTITDSGPYYCESVHQVFINSPGAQVVLGIQSPEICLGKSAYLKTWVTGKAPFTYLWNNGITMSEQTVTPMQTTVYSVTVTDGDGCTSVATGLVKVNALPVVQITGHDVLCAGQTATLNASGGGNGALYSWSNGKNGPTNTVNPGTTTTYTVTVTNLNGCTAKDDHTIIVNTPKDTLIFGQPQFLCGDSTEQFVAYDTLLNENCIRKIFVYDVFIQQTTDYIVWNPSETICGDSAQTYVHLDSLKKGDNCTRVFYQHEVTVIPFQDSIVWGITETVCGDSAKTFIQLDSLSIENNCTRLLYQHHVVINPITKTIVWGDIETLCGDSIITFVKIDNVVKHDSCKQTIYQHEVVIMPYQDSIVWGEPEFICGNTSKVFTQIDSTVLVNECERIVYQHEVRLTKYNTIVIEGPPQIICGETVTMVTALDSVQFTNNCTRIEYVHKVIAVPSVVIDALTKHVTCHGFDDGIITLSLNIDSSKVNISWNTGENTLQVNNLFAGNYSVTVTSDEGCKATKSFVIDQPDALLLESTIKNPICYESTDGLIDVQASGGTTDYNYVWNNGSNNHLQTELESGNYTVTVSDANGCTTNETFVLTQPDSISIVAKIQPSSCEGLPSGAINLTVSGGVGSFQYDWSDFFSQEDRTGLLNGQYAVTVTDQNGCEQTETFLIKENGCSIWFHHNQLYVIIGRCGEFPTFDFDINIYDSSGRVKKTFSGTAIDGYFEGIFDLSDLNSGIYFVKVISQGGEIRYGKNISIH